MAQHQNGPFYSQHYDWAKKYDYTRQYRHYWSIQTLLDAIIAGCSYVFEVNRSIHSNWAIFVLCHYYVRWASVSQASNFNKCTFCLQGACMCFVLISEQTVIVYHYPIWFYDWDGVFTGRYELLRFMSVFIFKFITIRVSCGMSRCAPC